MSTQPLRWCIKMLKILNIHGFASSGTTTTAKWLAEQYRDATVLSPDVPVDPHEAVDFLQGLVAAEQPNLIIGTSMGGMFAERFSGIHRILINPAFEIADSIRAHYGMGRQDFFNPRRDGASYFLINKALIDAFREVSAEAFSHASDEGEDAKVWGLFGRHDEVTSTLSLFRQHYSRAIVYEGGHRLDDHTRIHVLAPVLGWAIDKVLGRTRPVMFIALEDTLMKDDGTPLGSAAHAFAHLASIYDVYVVAETDWYDSSHAARCRAWVEKYLGVAAYNRLIITPRPDQLMGDYFISAKAQPDFIGTHITYGSADFREWKHVLTFFDRLGGQ